MKGANGQVPKLRPDLRLYLFWGNDEAGASALAAQAVAAVAGAERIDLDGAALRRAPGRLADEAASPSLFGDARVIRAAPLGEESVEAVRLLLEAPRADTPVVAIAPGLRATAKLVKLAQDHPRAVAVACYPPDAAQLDRIVTGLLTAAGLRPAPGLARQLAEAGGGDRAVIAAEVDKLALYLDAAPMRPHDAGPAELAAIGASSDEGEQDAAAGALLAAEPATLGAALARLDEGGASAIPWLRALTRRLIALAEMRAEVAGGDSIDAVVERRRLHFSQKAATVAALGRWSPAMLADALAQLRTAERAVVASGNAGAVLAEHAALASARRAERRR